MSRSDTPKPASATQGPVLPMAITEIVEQHAEEAAILWAQRDKAVLAPNYSLKDLARLDERVEAHLDGLRVAGESGVGGWGGGGGGRGGGGGVFGLGAAIDNKDTEGTQRKDS